MASWWRDEPMMVWRELAAVSNKIFSLKVPVVVWRIWKKIIPTRDNLVRRGVLVESQISRLYVCGREENVAHIFFKCHSALVEWSEVLRCIYFTYVSHNSAVHDFV